MLYPTLNQPLVIVMMLIAGFVAGLFFDICRLIALLTRKDKAAKHIMDFVATITAVVILYLNNLHFNYGQIRLYVVILFVLSFYLQRKLSQKLWTKLLQKWYSNIAQRKENWKKKRNKN